MLRDWNLGWKGCIYNQNIAKTNYRIMCIYIYYYVLYIHIWVLQNMCPILLDFQFMPCRISHMGISSRWGPLLKR
jgi:hypothetical protein